MNDYLLYFKYEVVLHDIRNYRKVRSEEFGELKIYGLWMRVEEQKRTHDDVCKWFCDDFKATQGVSKEEDCIIIGSSCGKNIQIDFASRCSGPISVQAITVIFGDRKREGFQRSDEGVKEVPTRIKNANNFLSIVKSGPSSEENWDTIVTCDDHSGLFKEVYSNKQNNIWVSIALLKS